MKHRLARTFLLAASLGFLAGCQTVDDRIKEKPEVFAKLDAVTQDKIKQGIIELGYTEDMVYLALGKPDQMRESVSAEGKATTWIYNTYYERYDGTRFAGYHRSVYYDPYIKAYRFYYRPVYADTYAQEKEERIRVSFKDGKATVTTAPGMPEVVPALATKAGISTTKTKITALYAAIDVSDQPPFEAMARLGLQIVQVPLP